MNIRPLNEAEGNFKIKTIEYLELDRARLLLDQAFIGAILIRQNLIPVVDWRCPSMSTDGQNIFVNPKFYLSFTPGERQFWLAHCVWHTVYMHFLRCQDRKKELFDVACDMEINFMLLEEKFKFPANALLPLENFRRLNAEQIYAFLSKNLKLCKNLNLLDRESLDIHLYCSKTDDKDDTDSSEDIVVVDPDYEIDFGDKPEQRVREQVFEAATQYVRKYGKLPEKLEMLINTFRSGSLNWKELLAQFVTRCMGGSRCWLPPNRRYIYRGLYLQSRRSECLKAVLAIDTSRSTVGTILQQFTEELLGLIKSFGQYELTVICCDSEIQSVTTFSSDDAFYASEIQFKGGGGTNFIPVFEYANTYLLDTQLLVFFTDGMGQYPVKKPQYPILWVLPSGFSKRVDWGEKIEIKI